MKKIITAKTEVTEIPLDECTEDHYYGFITLFDGKGFITSSEYRSDKFKAMSCSGVTYGNHFLLNRDGVGLHELLLQMIHNEYFKVYCFESPEELFTWLGKEPKSYIN